MNTAYADGRARLALAREIAANAMVLLKNESRLLPFSAGTCVAVLGQTQLRAMIGGGGSGASSSENALQINRQLAEAGLALEPVMDRFYQELAQAQAEEAARRAKEEPPPDFEGLVASGLIYEIFGQYAPAPEEPLPSAKAFAGAAQRTDTALFVLGRATGGEECDRRVENDYYLTPSEERLLDMACQHFAHVVAVLNVNGMVDMAWTQRPQVQAVLFMGTSGEQAAGALADLLTGKAAPSGKLAQTAALRYEDYPTARNITYSKDDPDGLLTYESYGLCAAGGQGFAASPATVYEEDIYVGYRYFDSFQRPVLYPFGFGLGYADFDWRVKSVSLRGGRLSVEAEVANRSDRYAGREVLQLYVHAPFGRLKKPWQELRAIAKTPLLRPGGACLVTLAFSLADMASFHEASMEYVLEPGQYVALLGNSSQNTAPAALLALEEPIVTRAVTADIGIAAANRGKVRLLEPDGERPVSLPEGLPRFTVTKKDVAACWPAYREYAFDRESALAAAAEPGAGGQGPATLSDLRLGRTDMASFIRQMTVKELAVLCNGYGSGLPFSGVGQGDVPLTIQEDGKDIGGCSSPYAVMGYCSPAIEKYGIPTTVYRDGPASVGLTAWPTGMMLACTFDPALVYAYGDACGYEARLQHVDSWLAPGMNLIRNPIEGRAFEYFSEDPFLTGLMAVQVIRGAMENHPLTACPKHFALNEQETYRRGSAKKNIGAVDTIVSARAARELYLRPFEMAVTLGRPRMVMTAFNKINGVFAAGNRALCTEILRGEWGFEGVVVTDWGDLDFVVDGADAVRAGNDVIMPGGPPVIAQVLKGYEEGRTSLEELRRAAAHLARYLLESQPDQKEGKGGGRRG